MMTDVTQATGLETIWFLLICILWLGYFVLEGFDFGVGMLMKLKAKTEAERRAIIHTIGPVWDANEVWLLTAGGATFAAFPEFYATLFSGAYLALFLILFALIARGVAFEFWGKLDGPRWRKTWEWAIFLGSALPALLWGVAWAAIAKGLPLQIITTDNSVSRFEGVSVPKVEFAGTLLSFITPYSLLGGVLAVALFLTHGAIFLRLRLTAGELSDRIGALARKLAPVTVILLIVFAVWTIVLQTGRNEAELGGELAAVGTALAPFLATESGFEGFTLVWLLAAIGGGLWTLTHVRQSVVQAFIGTSVAIVGVFIALFSWIFPNVMTGTLKAITVTGADGVTGIAQNAFERIGEVPLALPLHQAASSSGTLTVMTVVTVIFLPIVLGYTVWSYRIFRARLGVEDFVESRNPFDVIAGAGRQNKHDETSPERS